MGTIYVTTALDANELQLHELDCSPETSMRHLSALLPRRGFFQAAALALTLAAAGLVIAPSASAQAAKKLNVVATTGMIADAVRQVGGERVIVEALMGPGVDPHLYRQTRSDIVRMTAADAVIWHGLYLEAQLEEFFANLSQRKKVVPLGERIDKSRLLSHEEYKGRYDPHVWMDPKLWREIVIAARDTLSELDPSGKPEFEANAGRHLAEIDRLASYSETVLATVPQSARVLVTAHDAFNYFGRAYGFEVLGIQGISTESEAGLKQVEDLVHRIVDRKIKAVFVESSVADRNIQALIEGAAARGWTVEIGGELYSDAMGEPGTYEGTYIGMIDHNVSTIARALGGTVPPKGMDNRLATLQ
jgi:manganese/zinc/iron transport system substrate-binding protein